MTIANIILAQLGGSRFTAMTGAKGLMALENGLQMTLPRGLAHRGINRVRIILDASDTYTIETASYRSLNYTVRETISDVYVDQLRAIFTGMTGLAVSL